MIFKIQKRIRRCIFFLFPLIVASGSSISQTFNVEHLKLPRIIPASPEVASIQKFGNVPVSPSNGTTSISIPIWSIECGTIKWPFSFSYNTSGIKVDEISSTVGLCWTLAGTGVITRTVIGRADEGGLEPDYSTVSYSDWDYLYHVADGLADSEYDSYNYSFNGKSGKFFILQSGQIFAMPYTTMKITKTTLGFSIVDESGNTYTFEKEETTSVIGVGVHTSSWYLTKVQTSDKKQSIDFTYLNAGTLEQTTTTFTQSLGTLTTVTCHPMTQYTPSPILDTRSVTNTVQLISRIDFPNGYIKFNYADDRNDVGTYSARERLTSVEVYNLSGILLKQFLLTQSYYNPGNKLRLDALVEREKPTSPSKNYGFVYNSTSIAPKGSYAQDKWGYNNGKTNNPGLLQYRTIMHGGTLRTIGDADRSVDTVAAKAGILTQISWPTGGKTELTYDVHQFNPNTVNTVSTEYTANASGNSHTTTTSFTYPSYAGEAKIILDISRYDYPDATSGEPYVEIRNLTTNTVHFIRYNGNSNTPLHVEESMVFNAGHSYQIKSVIFSSTANPNFYTRAKVVWIDYSATPIPEKGGGLRVRLVKNYASNGTLSSTDYYEYEPGTTLSSYHFINLDKKTLRFNNCCPTGPVTSGFCDIYYSEPVFPRTTVDGVPIMYKKVTKYQLDANGANKGKTEYSFNVLRDEIQTEMAGFTYVYFTNNSWKNGTLIKESQYKRTGTNYSLIKTIENQYNEIKVNYINNLQVKYIVASEPGCGTRNQAFATQELEFFNVPVYTGINKLIKTIETSYDDNGGVEVSTTDYEFSAPSHDFLTKSKNNDSKNRVNTTTYKYPVDFSSSGNVYSKMITANIISPVIETRQYVNGETTLMATSKTTYRDWKNDALVLAPEFIQYATFNNALENKIVYTNYNDRKLPTEVKKDADHTLSYIYDYSFQHPIAEVKNASESNIAYTSFEADGKGGWTYTGTPIIDPTAPTGRKCFSYSGNISKSGLSSTKTYIVSYWKKSGSVTINSISGTAGRIATGWTYYEHKIVNPASGAISVAGSSAIIDELRLYPVEAQMVSSTYDVLVGITSQCDINNRILYYEYDELQRLILIRDQDKNAIKKFAYNYNGQTEYPSIFYNVARTGTFQKTGCTGCTAGSLITYTIPANTYLSTVSVNEANARADADIATNGQVYANAIGTCITPPDANVLSTITIGKAVQYTFYNRCTGASYVRNRLGNETDWPMTGIPQGNYDITFTVSPAGTHTFKVITPAGTLTNVGNTTAIIYNVVFGAGTNKVTATP